jgi:hypothetical protein
MLSDTIIAAPFQTAVHMHSLTVGPTPTAGPSETDVGRRLFKIRTADSGGHRNSANILVSRMYGWRGYDTSGATRARSEDANRVTLVAVDHDQTIGTISIGFDGANGLFVDDLFAEEVSALRLAGRTVCEFTKLAVDGFVRSKRVLASLFHVAYIFAHRLRNCDDLLIEVNPRHVRFYEQMLGLTIHGAERLNRRVNAPAVLMRLEFAHAHEQIARFSGQAKDESTERSLYRYFFSVAEEAGIVGRLQRGE